MLCVGGRLVVLPISDITATIATAAIASSGSFFSAAGAIVAPVLVSLFYCGVGGCANSVVVVSGKTATPVLARVCQLPWV